MYYVYILKCEDDSLYVGITTDVSRRFAEHLSGNALCAKYTRSRKAKSIEAVWSCETRASASRLEFKLKKFNHKQKKELTESPFMLKNKLGEGFEDELYTYEESMLISRENQMLSSDGSRK